MIEELLSDIPDKTTHMTTTSHQFKKDVWKFCTQSDEFRSLLVVELGTHNGQTTKILSYLFDNVITVNNNESTVAKEFNKEKDNITFYNFDLYREPWQFNNGDIFFIDADHSYNAVCMDIDNCLKLTSSLEKKIFIFDDYGANQHVGKVKRAVDTYINNGTLEIVSHIGHAPPFSFDGTHGKTLAYYEGIICQEV
tara:strand:+ start:7119 stop:7703 length:585 start_codon:yes stop_codon:yes gene_type:complete